MTIQTRSVDTESRNRGAVDLLQFRPISALFRWSWFPYVFQAVILAAFLGLLLLSWQRFAPAGVPDKLYAKTHLAQLLVWGVWWPAMVWIAVLFGRAWCTVCPMELVANGSERLGRHLGVRQLKLGRWTRAGVLILFLYALIQMLVAGVHLHRVPAYTSFFLIGLLGTAAVTGFLFRDRAFCRGFCPVGMLLNSYGRGGMLAMRHAVTQQCSDCDSRDCALDCNRERWQGRSCPSLLNPSKLDSNADCLICGQCIKACQPDNMQLLLRRPFHPADAREALVSWPLLLFIMMVSGFVTYELCTEWSAAKTVFLWAPQHLGPLLGLEAANGWVKGLWTLFLFPVLLWLVLGGIMVASGIAGGLGQAWRRLALPLVVVIAAGHMAKGIAKFTSWGGYLPGALRDPLGVETSTGLASGSLEAPAALLGTGWVSAISVLLILASGYFALREARLANPAVATRLAAPIVLVALCYGALALGWGVAG